MRRRWVHSLASRVVLLVALLGATSTALQPSAAAEKLPDGHLVEPGRRMYREGLLPTGQPMQATVQDDVALVESQVACVTCHRRSGLSSTEGQTLVPPVSGAWLYRPRVVGRADFYATRTEGPGTRPAYTDQTLARAIRDGVDAAGRQLDPLMPRYALGDDDLAPLIAYLKTLSSGPSPGVTDSTIHLATIVTNGVDTVRRSALLNVLNAFVRDKNAETRQETRRVINPPMHKASKYRAYRQWELHVWDLTGAPETWRGQLDGLYGRQPVFAVISGLGEGTWRPVHTFCEEKGIPCVLPNTDQPVVAEADFYSIYFSKGLALEADVAARHLRESGSRGGIVQVYRDGPGMEAADAFRSALGTTDASRLEDLLVASGESLDKSFWADLSRRRPPVLVLWLSDADLHELDALAGDEPPARIYLSSTLCRNPAHAIPQQLRSSVWLAHRFALADRWAESLKRVEPWLRSRHIPVTDPRVQLNAYFAARLAGEALMHIRSNFSRDYFIERIEHTMDRLAAPSAYPRLSLGADQRFASRGGYIVKLTGDGTDEAADAGTWIVP